MSIRTTALAALLVCLTWGPALALDDVPEGWAVHPTGYSYAELIERVEGAIAIHQMGLVNRASATLGAASISKEIPGNTVIGVFRPDFAVRMLEASVPAGIEAPIRLYITEEADGTATLSYRLPSVVFAPYDDGGAALDVLAAELDVIFAAIAAEATGD